MSPSHRLAIVCTLLIAGSLDAADPFCYPEAKSGTGELKTINGLPVLTVSGSPREMGEAVGVLAVKPAGKMTGYPEDLVKHYHLAPLWPFLVRAGKKMVEDFPADYRKEFESMTVASRVDRDRLAAGNTLFDLKKFLACSALLADAGRSATGPRCSAGTSIIPHWDTPTNTAWSRSTGRPANMRSPRSASPDWWDVSPASTTRGWRWRFSRSSRSSSRRSGSTPPACPTLCVTGESSKSAAASRRRKNCWRR